MVIVGELLVKFSALLNASVNVLAPIVVAPEIGPVLVIPVVLLLLLIPFRDEVPATESVRLSQWLIRRLH